ncbi:stage V sporulation protein R [Thermosyntropha lipolytica DSM 11003]|uniref:Stage V sporulation protein R n=1 Tax=Thermosyntropha lipolytica DSM 11003 TaxID=1123382 RepID=A0A1M5KFS2_9FIRM|nr:SpoVR family protein [Thermosyntropha lipolytica]SHG51784.1 stage V sporulation protein R [Thermosyntropha lipolytica DSM 11003]
MGSDYVISDLIYYNEKIEKVAREKGLDFYPQEFELCSYEDMIGYESYMGMPSRYPHWSFGKAYERKKTFYRYNLTGLPYEMVINSNPCLAYLMKDNTLLLQILTMAHVYGHNDFFKNNRLFKLGTRAENTLEMFKSHADRIRSYIADPSIGYTRVERIIDAAHSIRYQTTRIIGEKRLSREEQKERIISKFSPKPSEHPWLEDNKKEPMPDLEKIPLVPEEDLLLFLYEYAPLKDWEKDILMIVREESLYFLPQIETKIMNEGWASYWHYQILNSLDLPSGLHLEFLKRHNQVVAPLEGGINPYHLGFKIFEKLAEKNKDPGFIFEVREQERDASFLRRYLDIDLGRELNLFQFKKSGKDYIVSEIADDEGFAKIKETLIANVGMNSIPNIRVVEIGRHNMLMLEHEWEGRELNLEYAHNTVKHIASLWGGKVRLRTRIRNTIQIIESEKTE